MDPESNQRTFGDNVRRERVRRGLTLAALAAAAEIQDSEIGRLERGQRDPRLTTILRLAKGLGITPGELLQGIEPPPRRWPSAGGNTPGAGGPRADG